MQKEPARVERLTRERFDDVVDTLCDAFHDYPVMQHVLGEDSPTYDRHLARLVGYFTESRFARGWPVLGVVRHGEVIAAANVNPPGPITSVPELDRLYVELRRRLGDEALDRFEAFSAASRRFDPGMPHYYLGMIGVRRSCQGQGNARLLLDTLHHMSEKDPESRGVLLTTERPSNLPLYDRFGYRVLGEAQVGELRTWALFRKNPTAD